MSFLKLVSRLLLAIVAIILASLLLIVKVPNKEISTNSKSKAQQVYIALREEGFRQFQCTNLFENLEEIFFKCFNDEVNYYLSKKTGKITYGSYSVKLPLADLIFIWGEPSNVYWGSQAVWYVWWDNLHLGAWIKEAELAPSDTVYSLFYRDTSPSALQWRGFTSFPIQQ